MADESVLATAGPPEDLPPDCTLSYDPAKARRSVRTADTGFLGAEGTLSGAMAPPSARPAIAPPTELGVTVSGPLGSGFELKRLIGKGGMGEVWEAVQVSLGRTVAVKRLKRERESALELAERELRFRQEALISAQLEHPNIVPIHELGHDEEGRLLLAMKLVNGQSWSSLLEADFRSLSPEDFLGRHLPILIDVAQAVAFAHSKGIVHRDLKPAQVVVGEFGEVLLLDWGLALYIGKPTIEGGERASPPHPDLLTPDTATSPSGTPALMAPEQTLRSAHGIGPWTDVYLLGGTLYFLLTGTYPHEAKTSMGAFLRAAEGRIDAPSDRAPDREIPEELEALALKALARDPANRVESAKAFVAAIAEFLSGAGRRREAQAIVADVIQRLDSGAEDYRTFADCLAQLARAGSLWPASSQVALVTERALVGYTRLALRHGDLMLARVQLGRLTETGGHEDLTREVELAEERVRFARRQRQFAIAASFLMLLALIVAGTFFSVELARQRDAAAHERDLARNARASSDRLAEFMLTRLRDRLKFVDPSLTLLDEVADRAADHYRRVPLESLAAEERLATIQRLIEVAEVFTIQGNASRARTTYREAAELLDLPLNAAERGTSWTLARMQSQQALSVLANQSDRVADAIKHARNALALLEDVAPRLPTEERLSHEIRCRSALGIALQDSGDTKTSLDELGRAAELARQLARLRPEEPESLLLASETIWGVGEYQVSLYNGDAGVELIRESGLLATQSAEVARRLDQPAIEARAISFTISATYLGSLVMGDFAGAFKGQDARVERLRQLASADPANIPIHFSLLGALQTLSAGYEMAGQMELSQRLASEANAIVALLVRRDPNNIRVRQFAVAASREAALRAKRNGDIDAAVSATRDEIAGLEILLAADPERMSIRFQIANAQSELSGFLDKQDQRDEGRVLRLKALDTLAQLKEADPANPDYAAGIQLLLQRLAMDDILRGEFDSADARLGQSMQIVDQLIREYDENDVLKRRSVAGRGLRVILAEARGDAQTQDRAFEEYVAHERHLGGPNVVSQLTGRVPDTVVVARAYARLLASNTEGATALCAELLARLEMVPESESAVAAIPLAMTHTTLGAIARTESRFDEARDRFRLAARALDSATTDALHADSTLLARAFLESERAATALGTGDAAGAVGHLEALENLGDFEGLVQRVRGDESLDHLMVDWVTSLADATSATLAIDSADPEARKQVAHAVLFRLQRVRWSIGSAQAKSATRLWAEALAQGTPPADADRQRERLRRAGYGEPVVQRLIERLAAPREP